MTVYLIISTVIAAYCSLRLFAVKKALKNADAELNEILKAPEENRIVKLMNPAKEAEALFVTINTLLTQFRQKAADYRLAEEELKKEIEGISHDLRTPLTSVLGYLQLIDKQALSGEDQSALETVTQKAYVLQRLITQFYDLSRVGGENLTFHIEDTDISHLIREYITAYYAPLSERDLNVTAEIPDEPVIARIDANAFERVILNLLHNAAKYADSILRISLSENENLACIVFENDTGEAGIKNNRDIENTGLGLLIAKRLTESMNGKIHTEEDEAGGAHLFRVRIEFPK